MIRQALSLGLLTLPGLVFAQAELSGYRQYPQFRSTAALPGSGFGVLPDGHIDFMGAMSFSTPIAYSLGRWQFAGAVANTSNDGSLHWPNRNTELSTSNGTAFLMGGAEGKFGRATLVYMVVSSQGDSVYNMEYTPPVHFGKLQPAIGVQDLMGHASASDAGLPAQNSQSLFAVVTDELAPGAYLSAGMGSRRFDKGFINGSYTLGQSVKLLLEHDGFNWNPGVAFNLPLKKWWQTCPVSSTLYLGEVRGKYATFQLTFTLP